MCSENATYIYEYIYDSMCQQIPVQHTCTADIHSVRQSVAGLTSIFAVRLQPLPLLFSSLNQIRSGPKHTITHWYL